MIKRTLILFLGISLLLAVGCKKYEDGPLISFKSKKNRLVGTWELVDVDGVPSTNFITHEFKENGEYIESVVFTTPNTTQITTGTWNFDDKKENIQIWWTGAGAANNREILRLTSSELWLLRFNYNKTVEDHLERR